VAIAMLSRKLLDWELASASAMPRDGLMNIELALGSKEQRRDRERETEREEERE